MKTTLAALFLVASAALYAHDAEAQSSPPLISVSGSAEIKVVPDEIVLRVGIETRDANLDTSKQKNDERVARALAFLKQSGILAKDIQTDYVSVDPQYDSSWSRATPQIYIVRKSIEIKLSRPDQFEKILTGLLANGVNTVHDVQFKTTELRKHRDAARASAVKAAKEKADALAAELGVKAGRVFNISANDWGGWSGGSYWGGRGMLGLQNVSQNSGGAVDSGATMSLGQISVTASVNVSFLIE